MIKIVQITPDIEHQRNSALVAYRKRVKIFFTHIPFYLQVLGFETGFSRRWT